jgi:hypothetical protein
VSVLPTATEATFASLGGHDVYNWAQKALDSVPDDVPETTSSPGEILVLGLPYGGPNAGKDSQGQFFSPMTDFMDGVIDNPPVMYTHGTQNGFEPEPVGRVKGRWYDRRGGWFKVALDPQSPRYPQLIEANNAGTLRASTGAVPASYSTSPNGHIDTWLVGELSLVDMRDGYRPINGYAITKAEPVVFDDYYGEPVELRMPTIVEVLKEHFNAIIEAVTRHEVAEGDPAYMMAEGLPDESSYWKADFGGKKRSELKDSDFIFPDTRSFPVVTCQDFADAVNSWGRYKGSHSFEEFKSRMKARAKKLGCKLPAKWAAEKSEEEPMEVINTEKCESCEEALRLAEELKAELAVSEPAKCSRCPEAVRTVGAYVKAGRITPAEAFSALDRFTKSDDGLDAYVAEIEARQPLRAVAVAQPVTSVVPAKAEPLFIAGGASQPSIETTIDAEHMNKQRRLAGLPVK